MKLPFILAALVGSTAIIHGEKQTSLQAASTALGITKNLVDIANIAYAAAGDYELYTLVSIVSSSTETRTFYEHGTREVWVHRSYLGDETSTGVPPVKYSNYHYQIDPDGTPHSLPIAGQNSLDQTAQSSDSGFEIVAGQLDWKCGNIPINGNSVEVAPTEWRVYALVTKPAVNRAKHRVLIQNVHVKFTGESNFMPCSNTGSPWAMETMLSVPTTSYSRITFPAKNALVNMDAFYSFGPK